MSWTTSLLLSTQSLTTLPLASTPSTVPFLTNYGNKKTVSVHRTMRLGPLLLSMIAMRVIRCWRVFRIPRLVIHPMWMRRLCMRFMRIGRIIQLLFGSVGLIPILSLKYSTKYI
jgi:hypothetical protein